MSIIINNEKFYTPRGSFSGSENISEPDMDFNPQAEVKENKLVLTNVDYSETFSELA